MARHALTIRQINCTHSRSIAAYRVAALRHADLLLRPTANREGAIAGDPVGVDARRDVCGAEANSCCDCSDGSAARPKCCAWSGLDGGGGNSAAKQPLGARKRSSTAHIGAGALRLAELVLRRAGMRDGAETGIRVGVDARRDFCRAMKRTIEGCAMHPDGGAWSGCGPGAAGRALRPA